MNKNINDIINKRIDTLDYLMILFHTLRQAKGRDFIATNFKWHLGAEVVKAIGLERPNTIVSIKEPNFLCGIEVEIDHLNPWSVQIFEDITNKIAIDYGDPIKADKLEEIEKIIDKAESLHPEIAIGAREAIREIREVLNNDTSTEKS